MVVEKHVLKMDSPIYEFKPLSQFSIAKASNYCLRKPVAENGSRVPLFNLFTSSPLSMCAVSKVPYRVLLMHVQNICASFLPSSLW